jgi:ferredoxin
MPTTDRSECVTIKTCLDYDRNIWAYGSAMAHTSRDLFGADADGNRGEWREEVEIDGIDPDSVEVCIERNGHPDLTIAGSDLSERNMERVMDALATDGEVIV